jgi:hypothetical protein
MFNFAHGIPAVVKSLKAVAIGMGFDVSAFYSEKQIAISSENWNILADFAENYICSTKVNEPTVLKICCSPEEVEHEYLHILQGIVAL